MSSEKVDGCSHYIRRCKLVCSQCTRVYTCRLCHDAGEDHEMDRFAVTEVICTPCGVRQPVAATCTACHVTFGKYCCLTCRMFADQERGQFHCNGCGICRVGGRNNFTHCDVCGFCFPVDKLKQHQCIPDASHRRCPVCLEDIHNSTISAHVPLCSHMLHSTCYSSLLRSGHATCPVCSKALIDMTDHWRELDVLILMTPMPPVYAGVCCQALCRDCNKETIVPFHIEGLKCKLCGSYNTTRSGGSFLKRRPDTVKPTTAPTALASTSASTAGSSVRDDYNITVQQSTQSNTDSSEASASVQRNPACNAADGINHRSSNSNSIVEQSATVTITSIITRTSPTDALTSTVPSLSTTISSNQTGATARSTEHKSPELLTADKEIHLYMSVSAEEIEAADVEYDVEDSDSLDDSFDSIGYSSMATAVIQGLVDGISGAYNRVGDRRRGSEDGTIVSVVIDGEEQPLEEQQDDSEWETADEEDK